MRLFEETLKRNTGYKGKIIDYSKVTYEVNDEEVIFYTETLERNLKELGYDSIHISLLLEAIHHHDGARHSMIAPE